MIKVKVWSGGQTHTYPDGTSKSDIARDLLTCDIGYSVSEISKAIPMAYSQAHSLSKKIEQGQPTPPRRIPGVPLLSRSQRAVDAGIGKQPPTTRKGASRYESAVKRAETKAANAVVQRERASEAAGLPAGPKHNPKVGKLRTGNLPQDIDVGPCANCGFDLVVRRSPHGFMFTHVNATAEEYLATIQFCQAVPERLI